MFCQDKILVIAKPLFNHPSDDSTYGYHQMVSTKIRLIIFLQLKMEKLYTVSKNKTTTTKKKTLELTVAQIMSPYCKVQT